jgi:hypothetical protein
VLARYGEWKKAHADPKPKRLLDLYAKDARYFRSYLRSDNSFDDLVRALPELQEQNWDDIKDVKPPLISFKGNRVQLDCNHLYINGWGFKGATGLRRLVWEYRKQHWYVVDDYDPRYFDSLSSTEPPLNLPANKSVSTTGVIQQEVGESESPPVYVPGLHPIPTASLQPRPPAAPFGMTQAAARTEVLAWYGEWKAAVTDNVSDRLLGFYAPNARFYTNKPNVYGFSDLIKIQQGSQERNWTDIEDIKPPRVSFKDNRVQLDCWQRYVNSRALQDVQGRRRLVWERVKNLWYIVDDYYPTYFNQGLIEDLG